MLPYQKNDFTIGILNSLSEEEKVNYLRDTWLYKSTEFRKEQVVNLHLFECFDEYFIAYILVDLHRYEMMNFHHKFNKGLTLEIFATQTEEEEEGYSRAKGFYVGTTEHLNKYYNYPDHSKKTYIHIKVKVFYDDVARIIKNNTSSWDSKGYSIVRCKKLTVLE